MGDRMKKTVKFLSVLTVVSLLLSLSVFFASAKTITYRKGDADGDSKITVLDATTIQKKLASLIPDPDGMISLRGEIGGDTLDVTDATYIQKYLANITTDITDIGVTVTKEIADPTEPQTEPQTEPPTEPQTEAPTQPSTQAATYPYDEYELPFIPTR